jgi:RimJ/RimL family protein N-acetyltransferase
VVTQAVATRPCEERDLDRFGSFGSEAHIRYCHEEFGRSRGFRAIVLGVEDSNPQARRLYDRLGYEAFAADDFKYLGAPVPNPGVWMRKELAC